MGEPCKLLKHLVELAYAKGLRSDRKLCRLFEQARRIRHDVNTMCGGLAA